MSPTENTNTPKITKGQLQGNSSRGTMAYYAGAIDPRIDLAVVSCSFSTFKSSWRKYPHCSCGYVPDLLKKADKPDIAALIAPRKLIFVAGKDDYLADVEGVKEGFATAFKWYGTWEASKNLHLVIGGGGHQFYTEKTWPAITEIKEQNP